MSYDVNERAALFPQASDEDAIARAAELEQRIQELSDKFDEAIRRRERLRIRRELKPEIFATFERIAAGGPSVQLHGIEAALLDALDRICPEECRHEPSGTEDIVGASCSCGAAHSQKEQCKRCSAWVAWHDFPGRELQR